MAECLLEAGADPDLAIAGQGGTPGPRSFVYSNDHPPDTLAALATLFSRFPPAEKQS
jgi:hypothetical protein